MEDFFKEHPFAIAFCLGAVFLVGLLSGPGWLVLLCAILAAVVGYSLDSGRR